MTLQRTDVVVDANGVIRPFSIEIPEDTLDDVRRRVLAARWPDRETVANRLQGAQKGKAPIRAAFRSLR